MLFSSILSFLDEFLGFLRIEIICLIVLGNEFDGSDFLDLNKLRSINYLFKIAQRFLGLKSHFFVLESTFLAFILYLFYGINIELYYIIA